MFWLTLSMQYAVREGARYAVTGQTNLDPNSASQVRYLAVIESMKVNSMGLFEVLNPEISVINYGSDSIFKSTNTYDPLMPLTSIFGNSGDIIVLQLNHCTWSHLTVLRPFFQNGKYRFNVAATMRNEAFP